MKKFIASILKHLFGCHSRQTTAQTPPTPAYAQFAEPEAFSPPIRPIDLCSEEDVILGLDIQLGCYESVAMGPDGEYRRIKRNVNILCGCGHIIRYASAQNPAESESQKPDRRIEGPCFYCSQEYAFLVISGQLTPAKAQRLSLVCSDCARVTISGKLACRKHTIAITDKNGQVVHLGPDDQVAYQRQMKVQNILGVLSSLFTEDDTDHPKNPNEK